MKKPNIIGTFLLICLNAGLVSCTGNQENEKFPPMQFDSDLALLSANKIINNGFSVQLPMGFAEISGEKFRSLKSKLEEQERPILKTEVLNAFVDTVGALFILSKIDEPKLFQKLDDNFESSLRTVWGNDPIRSQFSINTINVVHFQLFNDNYVNIKIFIVQNNSYQLDYIIPNSQYYGYSKLIESSISTMNFKKTKEIR